MKKIIFLILWICSTKVYCQETPLDFVAGFFEELAPCGEPIYCYDYKFEIGEANLIITTKLFNYEGNPKKQVLTEETIYKIPVDKIESVNYFPYEGQEVYFFTFDSDIEKHKNKELEFIDFFPIDFNKYQLNEELEKEFKKNLDALIDNLR